MSHGKFVAGILAFVALVGATAFGQSADDQQRKIDELSRKLDQVLKEQDALKSALAERDAKLADVTTAVRDEALESYINSLSDRMGQSATVVQSQANPIRIYGNFRTRSGWSFDRNFGEDFGSALSSAFLVLGYAGFSGYNPKDGGKPASPEALYTEIGDAAADIIEYDSDDETDDDGSFVDARFRIGFEFRLAQNVSTVFELQAYGMFDNGVTPYPTVTVPTNDPTDSLSEVDLYQGYIEFNNIFGRPEFSSRDGRQEIVLGNEFQFGNNDFFNGETFDASRWRWKSETFEINAIIATLQSHTLHNGFEVEHPLANNGYDDDQLYSLYLTLNVIENHSIDLYWIYLNGHGGFPGSFGTEGGIRSNYLLEGMFNTAYYHTIGGRIGGVFPRVLDGLDWNVEGAYQFGDTKDVLGIDGTDQDVDGWTVEAELGLTFGGKAKVRIFGRFLFAEGGEMFGQDTGYIPLFPERHSTGRDRSYRARYGIFDIIPMSNVITGQLGITFDPAADWTIGLTGLWAAHDEDVITGWNFDEFGYEDGWATDDGIGWEIDAFVEYRHSDHARISVGLACFLPEDGAPLAGWFPYGRVMGTDDDELAFLAYLQAEVVF